MPSTAHFRDILFSDVELYLKMEEWNFGDNLGLSNPQVEGGATCPDDCGLCGMHTSHTALANVDLTNRCNLTCPVCFANANTAGYVYEPGIDLVRNTCALRERAPVAGRVVQFSGGEPTIHPQFFEILSMAREMGFSHIQAATNGIEFAKPGFSRSREGRRTPDALPAIRRRLRRRVQTHAWRFAHGPEDEGD